MLLINFAILATLLMANNIMANCESGSKTERMQCYLEECRQYYEGCKRLYEACSTKCHKNCCSKCCASKHHNYKRYEPFGSVASIFGFSPSVVNRHFINSDLTSKIIERVESGENSGTIRVIKISDDGKEKELRIAFNLEEIDSSESSDEDKTQDNQQ